MKKIIYVFLGLVLGFSYAPSYGDTTGLTVSDDNGLITLGNISTNFGFGAYTGDHQVFIRMLPDRNFLIDGRTYPRAYTLGVLRFEHTPEVPGTRAVNYDIDTNSQNDTHATNTNFVLTGAAPGDYYHVHDVHIDTANSTGGEVGAFTCGISGEGLAEGDCLDVYPGMGVIEHHSGTEKSIEAAFKYYTTFTNITGFLNYTASDTAIFEHDNDYVYLGNSAKFNDIPVNMATFAGNPGVAPVFEYSQGASSWNTVGAADGTNGFRQNGNLVWDVEAISDWATDTVNGVASKYWIRIQRTSNNISPVPVENKWNLVETVKYYWNSTGDVYAHNVQSGTYFPTFDNISNLDAFTVYTSTYMRVGDTVTGTIKVTTDPTSAGQPVVARISIPITSDFVFDHDAGGDINAQNHTGMIYAYPSTDQLEIREIPAAATAHDMVGSFTYRIR